MGQPRYSDLPPGATVVSSAPQYSDLPPGASVVSNLPAGADGPLPGQPKAPVPQGLQGPPQPPGLLNTMRANFHSNTDSLPSDGTLETAAHNIGGRAAKTFVAPLVHPINTLKGIYDSAAETGPFAAQLEPNGGPLLNRAKEFGQEYQQDKPLAFENAAGDVLGNVAQGGVLRAGGALAGYLAPKAQDAGIGIMNKSVLGVRKADIKRGANPGEGYFQAGLGPSLSMRSIADKAGNALDSTGEEIGSAIDNGTGSGVLIPGSDVANAVYSPANAARSTLNGPFGSGSSALDDRMASFDGRIQPQMTPKQVFNLKQGVAKNVSWSDPTAVGIKQVGQQITGGLSGVLTNHVPELGPLDSRYQNLTSLENLASDRALTGQKSLTGMGIKAGIGAAGSALGLSTLGPKGAALGLGAMALDSIPVKTSLASALYYGGKGVTAMGDGIRGLFSSSPAAEAPSPYVTFGNMPKPLALPAETIGNPSGEDFSMGSFPARNPIIPPSPRSYAALPPTTSAGEAQPMIGIKAPSYPPLAEDFARTRVAPTKFSSPPEPRSVNPRGLLNAPVAKRTVRTPKN